MSLVAIKNAYKCPFFLLLLCHPSFSVYVRRNRLYCIIIKSSNLWSNKSLYSIAYAGSKLYKGPFCIVLCRWLDLLAVVCPIFALIKCIQTLGFREKWETNVTIPTCSPLKDQRPDYHFQLDIILCPRLHKAQIIERMFGEAQFPP